MSLELTASHPTWAPRASALRAQTDARRATVVIVLCVLNIQPGLLGTVSNKPLIILSCLLAIYLVSSTRSGGYTRVPTHLAITLVLMIFLSVRVLADDRAMQTAHVGYMFITFCLAAVGAFAGEAVTISGNQRLALKVFVYFIALLAISACVTALISAVYPLAELQLTTLTLGRPDDSGIDRWQLYFPFTFTSAAIRLGNKLIPRVTGAYREPGIFQMYLLMALVITHHTTIKCRRAVRAFAIIALLLTFSSIGYPLAVATAVYALFVSKRRTLLIKTVVAAMAVVALTVIWRFGPLAYEKKVYEAQDTSESRVTAVANSISHLLKNPLLGTGFFVDQPDDLGLEGVSVIASMHMFGLVGLVLYAAVVVAALRRNYSPYTATMLLPLLGTLVFSQPLHFDAITFFMLGLNMRRSKPLSGKIRTREMILWKELLCQAQTRT
jgi:O-Antigen ligase